MNCTHQNLPGEDSDSSDDIQPTPEEIMREIQTPTLWQTWRDPTWRKYMKKLDSQMQQLLSHHRKMTKKAVVDPELQKAINETTQSLLGLKSKYSERVKQKGFSWSKQSLARKIGTEFAQLLEELKEFHSESKAKAFLQQMIDDQRRIAAKRTGAIATVQSNNPPEASNLITDGTTHSISLTRGLQFGGNNTIYVSPAMQQTPIPVGLGEPSASSSAESPTARVPIDMWEVLTVTDALLLLDGIIIWLGRVERHTCVYWLSDGTDIQRALVMLHLEKTFTALAAPGLTLNFRDQTVRQNIKSSLVASMGQDLCRCLEDFNDQWGRYIASNLPEVPLGMEEQVDTLLVRVFNDIPHVQRKAILVMVDGLECCNEEEAEDVFGCLEACFRGLPVCFLISSDPEIPFRQHIVRLSSARSRLRAPKAEGQADRDDELQEEWDD